MNERGPRILTLHIREKTREFMECHLGCTPKEIAYGTGFTQRQIQAACSAIRKEWLHKLRPCTADAEAVERAMDIIYYRGLGR